MGLSHQRQRGAACASLSSKCRNELRFDDLVLNLEAVPDLHHGHAHDEVGAKPHRH